MVQRQNAKKPAQKPSGKSKPAAKAKPTAKGPSTKAAKGSVGKSKSSVKAAAKPTVKPVAKPIAKPATKAANAAAVKGAKPAPTKAIPGKAAQAANPAQSKAPPSTKVTAVAPAPVAAKPGIVLPGQKPALANKLGLHRPSASAQRPPVGLKAQQPLIQHPPLRPLHKVRQQAADELGFRVGDHVVYPSHGVGKVLGIENQDISGHMLQVITVHFDKDRMTLRVPIAKAKNSGLRRLSSRKVMDTALQTLKGRSRVKRTMWSRRAQEYEAKINSGDPVSIAEVVRDLHRNAGQPDQSYSERQIYQAALDRLVRELAAVERIDEEAATQRLEQLLKAA